MSSTVIIQPQRLRKLRGFRALIIGPPGSGKGFISNKIAKRYGAKHIATGDILRKHIQYGTNVGKEVKRFIKKGYLVPDSLLMKIVNGKLFFIPSNYVLDGYPRNIKQALNLNTKVHMDFVINLDLPHTTILKRVSHRLVHLPSGRVYSEIGPNSPRVEGRDDITGDRLVRRYDDDPEIWYRRLKNYYETMIPVLHYYQKKNKIVPFQVRDHQQLWPQIKKYLINTWSQYY